MMKVPYFAVYDRKSNSYGQMFPSATFGSAERSFQESVKSSESMHGKYPDDFALYCVLELDDESGAILTKFDPPQLIVEASALV